MTNTQLTEPELDQRLRTTLRAVAATVADEPTAAPQRRRPGRRVMIGLGAVAIAVPLAAGAFYGVGPEYVDKLPPDNVIVAGSIGGSRYWVFESSRTDECGKPVPGVELGVEEHNLLGQEWNTSGHSYGEPRPYGRGGRLGRCGNDVSEALADPALSYSSGTFVGDAFVRVFAVHPDITAVRLTIDGATQDVGVHRVDGAGYSVVEVPPDSTQFTVELLIDGEVVPDSEETRAMPDPSPGG